MRCALCLKDRKLVESHSIWNNGLVSGCHVGWFVSLLVGGSPGWGYFGFCDSVSSGHGIGTNTRVTRAYGVYDRL